MKSWVLESKIQDGNSIVFIVVPMYTEYLFMYTIHAQLPERSRTTCSLFLPSLPSATKDMVQLKSALSSKSKVSTCDEACNIYYQCQNFWLVHGCTCAGILPTQYINILQFTGIGNVGHGYIRQDLLCTSTCTCACLSRSTCTYTVVMYCIICFSVWSTQL